jgi:signal transduction histidine kinase
MLRSVTAAPRPPRLRWLIVFLPALLIALIEEVSDTYLDPYLPFPFDNLMVSGTVLAIACVFAYIGFRRIDHLTGALRAQNAELEAASASARALNRVSVAIAAETGLDHVLQAVVSYARQLLAADVAVLLLEGADGRLALRAGDGVDATANAPVAGLEPDAADADAILAFVGRRQAVARLSAPLQRGGSTIGVLAVGSARVRSFDVDEVETLASLASQAVIALEHDRLEARLRELAVVDERERIARELHDGIAQVLAYVNTKSQAVDAYLEGGRVPEARAQLAELGSAARAVYVDVRESIVGLRGPIEPGQGLGTALAAHARRVAEASRFGVELAIDPATERLRLDADAESNLYRIVQEALTNVRKHASAGRVRLTTRIDARVLTVTVADDGRGLPPGGAMGDKPGYGLRAMRERATRIGATLQVMNQVAGGAMIRVVLPLVGHEPDTTGTKIAVMAGPGATPPTASGPAPVMAPASGSAPDLATDLGAAAAAGSPDAVTPTGAR